MTARTRCAPADWLERIPERIRVQLVSEGECIVFSGRRERGYGRARWRETGTGLVHRGVYIALFGDPGREMEIDHLCRNRACTAPWHLEAVTALENNVRRSAVKTHCKQGHPFSGDNLRLYTRQSGRIHRLCVTCCRAQKRAQYLRSRKAA